MSTFMANKGNIERKWYILDAAGKPSDRRRPTREPDNQPGKSATGQAALYLVRRYGSNLDGPLRPGEGILHHSEGVDLMPADIQLSGMEVSLVNAMSRETILRQYLDTLKGQYSHILIDCQPSLGMLTVNALAAANRIIIPVQAEYLPAKGLEQLLSTVNKVKRQINPKLQIDGILLTMVDSRTNFAKEISALLRETYGSKIKVFGTEIPHSVRAKEISAEGKKYSPMTLAAKWQRGIEI